MYLITDYEAGYRAMSKGLNAPRTFQLYFEIAADSDIVSKHNFSLPGTISVRIDGDGKEYYNHLFADDEGIAKIKLNNWEAGVLAEESKRPDFICWLRNPSKAKWSLCIPCP